MYTESIEREAVRTFGKTSQMIVAIEECSELIKELTKNLRGEDNADHISEEMADVYIMLDQLGMIFGNSERVSVWKRRKINRLAERLKGDTICNTTDS